jgi:aconitate hydratase
MNFIASPEIVTALALAGRLSFNPLTDTLMDGQGEPYRLDPPAQAPEVPAEGFDKGRLRYVSPPEDGSGVDVQINPESQRLERLKPWPAWDGQDFLSMPVLLKAQGKTTTDHISPAGPWLRYRGHLDRFSDNMFSGATNAFSAVPGTGIDLQSGDEPQALSTIARQYKALGIAWVAVGDYNYGEGSSREHAALSPRLLGGVAVIARSFARIHESNLKKQGILALTFDDPSDYDSIRFDDHVSLLRLQSLSPGMPVDGVVRHSDGSTQAVRLKHSYSETQLEWFRRGSALNSSTGTNG